MQASAADRPTSLQATLLPGPRRLEIWIFAVFAVLLAIVTVRHEMFHDELQAWLIARDSTSIPDLFRNMRYEGHPALWQLILYIPAHISWNPASMQVINYFFAIAECWLILSARGVRWYLRVLAVFSFYVFYGYGAVSRNYMLATLMLTAAALCLLPAVVSANDPAQQVSRSRRWLGILLLVLAMNAHFFAIPVVAVIFLWLYCFPDGFSVSHIGKLFRSREFWVAVVIMLVSLAGVYFTVRPPADIYTPGYVSVTESFFGYFLISLGRSWQSLLPVPGTYIPQHLLEVLVPRHKPSIVAALLSLAIFLLIAGALRTARARSFLLCAALFSFMTFSVTVHFPSVRHYGLVFASVIIALMIDAVASANGTQRTWLPDPLSAVLLVGLLTVQAVAGLAAAGLDVMRPYSEAREASQWLKQSGLASNPMVMQPDYAGVGVVGYLERPTAYYTTCRCLESFIVWSTLRKEDAVLTQQDLDRVSQTSPLSVIVLANAPLDPALQEHLSLHLLQTFDHHPIYPDERFFIYRREN